MLRIQVRLALALMIGGVASAAAEGAFEGPPVLPTTDFVSPDRMQGEGYRLAPEAVTDGFRARFTIHSNHGVFQPVGAELLAVRLREIAALNELARMSKSGVFAASLKDEAVDTGQALKQAAGSPKETLQGVPSGVGRFFKRVERAGKTGVQKVQDQSAEREAEGESFGSADAQEAAGQAAGVTADALGLDEARRKLAKDLGVDPYTFNEVLSNKLDEVAKAAFAGSVGVRVGASFVPGSVLVSTTKRASDWVWNTPPGDLKVALDKEMRSLGASQDTVDRLLRHPFYSLTMLVALQSALSELRGVEGLSEIGTLGLSAESYDQARFVTLSCLLLARMHREGDPFVRVEVPGPIAGRTASGELVVIGVLDYLTWNDQVAGFVDGVGETPARSFWTPGRLSPRARAEFTARGWEIHDGSEVPPPGYSPTLKTTD